MSRRPHVLIVDDEPGTVRVLASVLEDAGYTVETAANGRVALEILATAPHDVVLLDYLMPHLDGCETLSAIRKNRAFAAVRVVMMSGVTESIIRRRCRGGYDAFLWKPFSLDDLVGKVKGLTRRPDPKTAKKKRSG